MRILQMTAICLGLACISTGNFEKLSQSDQDMFRRCMTPTQQARCGTDTDLMYVTMCNRGSGATYADLPSKQARMEWLVGNGCPPSMVQPERFVAAPTSTPALPDVSPAPTQSTPASAARNSGAGGAWADPFK